MGNNTFVALVEDKKYNVNLVEYNHSDMSTTVIKSFGNYDQNSLFSENDDEDDDIFGSIAHDQNSYVESIDY